MPYATYPDVNQLLPEKAQCTLTTTPNTTTLTDWIAEYEATLNAALKSAGYTVPVTGSNDIALCRGLVAKGVACLAWGVRFPVDETALPKQVDNWCQEWTNALKAITEKKLPLVDQSKAAKVGVIYLGTMQDED